YFVGTISHADHDLEFPLWNLSRHEGNSSHDPNITKKRIEMSERWMERNPDDPDMPRMVFYLAEAYTGIDPARAIELYTRRLSGMGYYQEKYISLLKLARLVDAKEKKLAHLIAAQEMIPDRLEAFYDMLMIYQRSNQHRQACGVFFMAPISRTPSGGSLFVEKGVY